MATDSKDTVYIDVDEEITGIISKVQSSKKDIVALVLPKRAAVLQSIVNMKLLKRAEGQHGKKVVLITSESRILPLAGAAGLFVASNLTSKPYVPLAKVTGKETAAEAENIDPNTPVSQVAPHAKYADSDSEIEIDNTPKEPEAGAAASVGKSKKNKKNKVPNFSKFRKKAIIISLAVIVLLFGLFYALFIAPTAKVTVKAQTNDIPVSLDFIADTSADSFDSDLKIVRATSKDDQKDDSEKVAATGEKDEGKKASGSISFNAGTCTSTVPKDVKSGTFISNNNLSYIIQSTVHFQPEISGTTCYFTGSSTVLAQNNGDKYNNDNATFTVSGRADVTGQGSTSGGTSKIIKVVAQSDIDKAKERINGKPSTVHDEFVNQLKSEGYVPIEDSFKTKPGHYDISPAVGQEADEVTVSVTTKYTMLGVKKEDLQQLIKDALAQNEDGKSKSILSDGIDSATFKLSDDSGRIGIIMNTTAVVGPNLDQENIKNQIAGKKSGEAESILAQVPGINEPKVELSPFWVGKVPQKHSKITIDVQQADGSQIP